MPSHVAGAPHKVVGACSPNASAPMHNLLLAFLLGSTYLRGFLQSHKACKTCTWPPCPQVTILATNSKTSTGAQCTAYSMACTQGMHARSSYGTRCPMHSTLSGHLTPAYVHVSWVHSEQLAARPAYGILSCRPAPPACSLKNSQRIHSSSQHVSCMLLFFFPHSRLEPVGRLGPG